MKTIGDAYMAVAGVPELDRLHVLNACLTALTMQDAVEAIKAERQKLRLPSFAVRIGLHTGPVIAGVVGRRKFAYDVWGDGVNIASLMESHGEAGRINVSEQVFHHMAPYFEFNGRGPVDVKNKEPLAMYFLERLKPEYSDDAEGRRPNSKLLAICDPLRGIGRGDTTATV